MQKVPLKGGGFGYVSTSAERRHNDVVKAVHEHVVVENVDHPKRPGEKMRKVRLQFKNSSDETKAVITGLNDRIKKLEDRIKKLENAKV